MNMKDTEMNKEIPEDIYTKGDIERAFDIGVATAVAEFEKAIGLPCDMQRCLLQSMINMLPEENVDSEILKYNQNKVVTFRSYSKK